MLGARRSRRLASKGQNPLAYAKQKEEPWILFYPASSTDPNLSPTSSTSCETSLASSTYMETNEPVDHVKLSPGVESTSSRSQSPTSETVLQTNKYCGSAYVKARKQRHDMIDTLSEYEDPPLDHLDLSLSPSFESDSSIESQPSEMFQDASSVKETHEVVETTSSQSVLPSLPSRWPQSSWKIGSSSRTISAIPTKLPSAVKKYLKKSYDSTSATNVAASSNINETVNNDHQEAEALSTTKAVSSNASDTEESRKKRHILKVKALARMRKERNEKRAEELKSNPPSPKSITTKKPSKSFKDFVDHLLMVNATNELCRSPNSPNSMVSSGTLPPVEKKKRVSWKVDPELPKPTLERRTAVGSNLPKPVLRRNFANRFSSKPIGDGNAAAAPFDEEPFAYNLSSSGWKSVFMCGSGDDVLNNL